MRNIPRSRPDRPLVKGDDYKMYPQNPNTQYISRFAVGFFGCLGCGSESHKFRECPQKSSSEMKKNCFLELNTHVPSTRNEEDDHSLKNSHYTNPAHQNNLSVYTNSSNSNPPSNQSPSKKYVFVLFLLGSIISPTPLRSQYRFLLIILFPLFASTLGQWRMRRIKCVCYWIPVPL